MPINRPILTVQTSPSTKKGGKGRCASAAGVKSPSSFVTPAPSASVHKRPRPKSMRAGHGEARCDGVSSLPSSLSSAAAPLVASPVVPAGEFTNTSAVATSEAPNAGMAVSSGRGEVVEIIEPFMKHPPRTVRISSEASTDDVTIAPVNPRSHI
ncbi:hypothetical protein AZE42_08029 [Rhizopogon vesiculosus]|uniref:Uncharacterized protein n=1 Tax=Rhizopogon vesiculosus TaxID=180088 RepID=A0A1J8PVT5_9AGAM|nr:hypothetical protein AZE42_08029 [Rhizopogon vesiculosus]